MKELLKQVVAVNTRRASNTKSYKSDSYFSESYKGKQRVVKVHIDRSFLVTKIVCHKEWIGFKKIFSSQMRIRNIRNRGQTCFSSGGGSR